MVGGTLAWSSVRRVATLPADDLAAGLLWSTSYSAAMVRRNLDPDQLGDAEDWVGNNAAFTCPECMKVFVVSQMLHRNGRDCPSCGRSRAKVTGGSKSGGTAWIETP